MPALNRRDQAQAYAFLSRRLAAALVRDEPDAPDAPLRKLGVAAFSSIMVALLAVAAFGVIGLVHPGGATSWKNGQSLILEKDTGTRYIYAHGTLHPVLNYASARLALGQAALSIVSVSAASLRGTPRGLPIGIPGAPDELPGPGTLIAGPWSVCSRPAQTASGSVAAYVRVSVGLRPGGTRLTAAHGLLVAGLDGTAYLVWNDRRLRVAGGAAALTALGYANATPLVVGDAWLSTLSQGPDLAPPVAPGAGRAGPDVAGRAARVGQVFATGPGSQYYLELRDGLAPITPIQADLLLASPASRALYPSRQPAAIRVTAVAAAAVRSTASLASPGLPDRPPGLVDTGNGQFAVCESYPPGISSLPSLWTASLPAAAAAQASAGAPADATGVAIADQVRVPPGGGVVAQAVPAPGVSTGTLYLVTDQGLKYPLANASVLTSLGLPGAVPERLPSAVLDLLPTGPTLDPGAANQAARS